MLLSECSQISLALFPQTIQRAGCCGSRLHSCFFSSSLIKPPPECMLSNSPKHGTFEDLFILRPTDPHPSIYSTMGRLHVLRTAYAQYTTAPRTGSRCVTPLPMASGSPARDWAGVSMRSRTRQRDILGPFLVQKFEATVKWNLRAWFVGNHGGGNVPVPFSEGSTARAISFLLISMGSSTSTQRGPMSWKPVSLLEASVPPSRGAAPFSLFSAQALLGKVSQNYFVGDAH